MMLRKPSIPNRRARMKGMVPIAFRKELDPPNLPMPKIPHTTESSHRYKSRVCVKRVLRARYPQVDIVNGHLMLGRPVRANPLSYFEVKEGKRREEEE
jgi:hypothetical protein